MKAIRLFAFTFAFIVVLALFPLAALAAGDLPPAPTWSDLMNATIAQGIAWLIAFGVTAAVAYTLNQFPALDAKIKTAIGGVVTVMLVAGVTALGALIPQEWMDQTIFGGAIALLTLLVNTAGHYFGSLKGQEHYVARVDVRQQIAAMRLPALLLLLGGALALSLLILGTPSPAFAESPQPYTYALVKCSGLPVDILILAEQDFDTAYGWSHQLTTPAQWSGSYEARVNEFASLLGCPQVLQDGQLTRWFKFYSPTYQHILRDLVR